jgi:uncharacterized protein (TIGR02646 family)
MRSFRNRAIVLDPIESLTAEEHTEIKQLGINGALDWSTKDGPYGMLVVNFRAEAKDHYYRQQRRRCCYCSVELQDHKLTYDAEHILNKAEYKEYMFEPANLAVACKHCNGSKSNRPISATGKRFATLSTTSDEYVIVHPHLDEWDHHLKFDAIGRIIPQANSLKGRGTSRICGFAALNATRLADEFAITGNGAAETALRKFHEISEVARKRELLALLTDMATRFDHAGSRAVIGALQSDIDQEEPLLVAGLAIRTADASAADHEDI